MRAYAGIFTHKKERAEQPDFVQHNSEILIYIQFAEPRQLEQDVMLRRVVHAGHDDPLLVVGDQHQQRLIPLDGLADGLLYMF